MESPGLLPHEVTSFLRALTSSHAANVDFNTAGNGHPRTGMAL